MKNIGVKVPITNRIIWNSKKSSDKHEQPMLKLEEKKKRAKNKAQREGGLNRENNMNSIRPKKKQQPKLCDIK